MLGSLNVQPIPSAHDAHIQQLTGAPWFAPAFAGPLQGCEFKLVELDPLLAYQFTVNDGRSQHHCGGLSRPPTMTQLVELCLPVQPAVESFQTFVFMRASSGDGRHPSGREVTCYRRRGGCDPPGRRSRGGGGGRRRGKPGRAR